MIQLNRRVLLGQVSLLALVIASGPGAAVAQEQGGRVGAAREGRSAIEFVGKVRQEGSNFTAYGYVTHLAGIDDSLLFTDPASRSEATARFTFSGTAPLTSRFTLDGLFSTTAAGTLSFRFDPAGTASFDTPASFSDGAEIAVMSFRFHDVLVVDAPAQGIASGDGEFEQQSATAFVLDGTSYTLGRAEQFNRVALSGLGKLLDPAAPVSETALSGTAFGGVGGSQ